MKSQKLLLLLMTLVIAPASYAQVGITAVPFLEINNDARSLGMGGATVALNHSKGGIHLNPATFGKLNTFELSTQFNREGDPSYFGTRWLPSFNGVDLQLYSPQVMVGFEKLLIGYQHTFFDLGEQAVTGENGPEIIDTFNSYEFAHTFSFGYAASENVSIGMGINYVKSSLATGTIVSGERVNSADAMTLDFGIYADETFRFDFIDITPSIGWSLADFGYPLSYTATARKDPLPIMMRGGMGLRFDIVEVNSGFKVMSVGVYGSLEKIMARHEVVKTDIGAGVTDTSYVAIGPFRALIDSWKPYQRFDGQGYTTLSVGDQFRRLSGVEITVLELLSIRLGHFYEHPDNGDREYNTYGFGLQVKYFSIDYAEFSFEEENHPLEGTKFWQFTMNIPLDLISKK